MKERIIIIFCIFLFSCSNQQYEMLIDIISPQQNWKYDDNHEILFATNYNNESVEWFSSIDGYLGTGTEIYSTLSAGIHEIVLRVNNLKIEKKIIIEVLKEKSIFDYNCNLIQQDSINFLNTMTSFAIYSENGIIEKMSINTKKNRIITKENKIIRDCVFSDSSKNRIFVTKEVRKFRNLENYNKSIYVMNTKNQDSSHFIDVELFYSSEYMDVFIEKKEFDFNIQENIIKCIKNFENIIFPRLLLIWGAPIDLDGNNKISIIFSSTINDEKVAVGFFNRNDFYKKESNQKSDSFNPYSNEMDVIYLAIPDDESNSYSIESISATFAHEMTHLILYSNQVYLSFLKGNKVKGTELFIDEGLSHLTETLCGFGISGGNQEFVNFFLKSTFDYSFCEKDIYGMEDSVGRRGATCLFLYWLFNKAGGGCWTNEGYIIDNGGISFLQYIKNQNDVEWMDLGGYWNKNTDIMYREFCKEMYSRKMCEIFDFSLIDPITNEPIFKCDEIRKYNNCEYISKIIPYSFGIFDFSNGQKIQLEFENIIGNVFILY